MTDAEIIAEIILAYLIMKAFIFQLKAYHN